jgi:hypothetical protein
LPVGVVPVEFGFGAALDERQQFLAGAGEVHHRPLQFVVRCWLVIALKAQFVPAPWIRSTTSMPCSGRAIPPCRPRNLA